MEVAGRLLASLRRLATRAREVIQPFVESMRARDRYFWQRSAVLGAWAALSLMAIGIARSGGAGEADNALQAYVALRDSALGWAILVHNRSDEPWVDVAVEVDGGKTYRAERIEPDQKIVLSPWQFVGEDGKPASGRAPSGVVLRVGRKVIRPPLSREGEAGDG